MISHSHSLSLKKNICSPFISFHRFPPPSFFNSFLHHIHNQPAISPISHYLFCQILFFLSFFFRVYLFVLFFGGCDCQLLTWTLCKGDHACVHTHFVRNHWHFILSNSFTYVRTWRPPLLYKRFTRALCFFTPEKTFFFEGEVFFCHGLSFPTLVSASAPPPRLYIHSLHFFTIFYHFLVFGFMYLNLYHREILSFCSVGHLCILWAIW